MATLDEIGRERQRVSEQLVRLDTERTKLANDLNELEIAERVLTQFGRRRGRPASTAPVAGRTSSTRGGRQAPTVGLGDAVLKA
ncbi:MAG TPA: hypothetical protein VE687_09460, partial [Stellaceae bacterium]|nr:hypothetical protein [Stellaceae bacterium]